MRLTGDVQTVSTTQFTMGGNTTGLKNNKILLWSQLWFCLSLLCYPELGKVHEITHMNHTYWSPLWKGLGLKTRNKFCSQHSMYFMEIIILSVSYHWLCETCPLPTSSKPVVLTVWSVEPHGSVRLFLFLHNFHSISCMVMATMTNKVSAITFALIMELK